MKQTVQYIIYCVPPSKKHSGILGNLDTYTVYLLLIGGKKGIEETIDKKTNPIDFYTNILKEQDMTIKSSFTQTLKDIKRVWIEIDSASTDIKEYTQWNELEKRILNLLPGSHT